MSQRWAIKCSNDLCNKCTQTLLLNTVTEYLQNMRQIVARPVLKQISSIRSPMQSMVLFYCTCHTQTVQVNNGTCMNWWVVTFLSIPEAHLCILAQRVYFHLRLKTAAHHPDLKICRVLFIFTQCLTKENTNVRVWVPFARKCSCFLLFVLLNLHMRSCDLFEVLLSSFCVWMCS